MKLVCHGPTRPWLNTFKVSHPENAGYPDSGNVSVNTITSIVQHGVRNGKADNYSHHAAHCVIVRDKIIGNFKLGKRNEKNNISFGVFNHKYICR